MKKQILSILLILLLSMGLISTAMAVGGANGSSEAPESIELFEKAYISSSDLELDGFPSEEELFAGYVQKLMDESIYGDSGAFFGRLAREQLDDFNKLLYDELLNFIEEVAAGERSSTRFEITLPQEIVDSELTVSGNGQEELVSALSSLIETKIDLSLLSDALLYDHPYELYWHDKTGGADKMNAFGYSYGMAFSGHDGNDYTSGKIASLGFFLEVSPAYQAAGYSEEAPAVDTAKTGAASQLIVDPNDERETNVEKALAAAAGCSTDYEKIMAFAQWICDSVEYNYDAADDDWQGGYGDPWQLIYVFDGLPGTKVVCEGYSKAFQYLCDLAGIECYSVSGRTGENHMWNIVRLNGQSYIVDVTNSDAGSIGHQGGELLVGYASSGSVAEGYTISVSSTNAQYIYNEDMKALWGSDDSSILKLATAEYEEPEIINYTITATASPTEGGTVSGAGSYEENADVTLTATAKEGYEFVEWQENGSQLSTDASISFTAMADRTLVAIFEKQEPPVVSLTKGDGEAEYYTTLGAAVTAAGSCVAADAAVLTLLDDIDLGEDYQGIGSGVFTLDLNGFDIICDSFMDAALAVYNAGTVLNITDSSQEKSSEVRDINIYAGTVNISGGTFDGVIANGGNVNITGGSFDGMGYGLYVYSGTITLSLPEGGGDGATFPGGITVSGTTLNAILGEGAAYWQGNKMIILTADATEITGGDVTIKKACDHSGNTNESGTDNEDGTHSISCSECSVEIQRVFHEYGESGICGVCENQAVASLTKDGGTPTYFYALDAALNGASSCTAADEAVLSLLDDIDLGEDYQGIGSGVFALDLNGFDIICDSFMDAALAVYNAGTVLSITDSSQEKSSEVRDINIYAGTVNISGGTFDGVIANGGTVNITGGSFDGMGYGLYVYSGTITLGLPEGGGDGATFPGGITVSGTTLNAILGEGAAYWQGNSMITPADDATSISGGDVVIKAAPPTYSVSISDSIANGSVTADKEKAVEGEQVKLTVEPDDGYLLDSLSVSGGITPVQNGEFTYVFNMPANAVEVSATFKTEIPTITLSSNREVCSYKDSPTLTMSFSEQLSAGRLYLYIDDESRDFTVSYFGGTSIEVVCNLSQFNLTTGNHTLSMEYVPTNAPQSSIFSNSVSVYYEAKTYNVSISDSIANGSVTADKEKAVEGEQVKLTVSPAEGYLLDSLTVSGGITPVQNGEFTYVFNMPADDVTVTATFVECDHSENTNSGRDKGDGTHSISCSVCSVEFTEAHDYDESGKCTVCDYQAVVSLTKGEGEPSYYATLDAAVTEAEKCTAEDAAVLTLLADIDQGEDYQTIASGVFTLDLNGFELSSTSDGYGALYVINFGTELTITDSSQDESGSVSGGIAGVELDEGELNLQGGTLSGSSAVFASYGATVNINGGTLSGDTDAVWGFNDVTINISDGILSGVQSAVDAYNATANISGGSFDGTYSDLKASSSGTITLSLPEYGGDGATFPGGIEVDGTTLNAILGQGAAYWQGNSMITPADDATEISGGDVTIKKACDHSENTNESGTDNGDGTHSISCSECGVEFVTNEAHSFSFSAEQHVLSVSCEKCDMETAEISLVEPADLLYDGSAKIAATSGSVPGLTLAELEYCCEDGCINAGEHTVSLTMGEATAELSFEITAAEPTLSWAEASESLTYTGSPAAITAPVVTLVNNESYSGQILYSYSAAGETEEKAGLPTDVGEYSVKASIPAAGNYTAAESNDRLSLTITAKAIEAVNISVSGLEESYDYTGQPIQPEVSVLVDGNAISEADYEVSYGENTNVADGGTVKVTLKHNYSGAQSFRFAIRPIEQADFRILGPLSATYEDEPIQLSTEGGSGKGAISWEIISGSEYASIDQNGLLTILGAGSVTVQATKATDGNYLAASDSHSIRIAKAPVSEADFTYTAPADLVYSRSLKEATVSGKEGFGEITIKYYSNAELTEEAEPLLAGTYYVGILMAESANYEGISVPMAMGSFEITPKPLNVAADEQSRKYGEENPELSYSAPELIDGDSLEGALFTEATKDSDVGEYEISQGTLSHSEYEISFTGATLTIVQADGPIAPTVTGSYVDDGMSYTFTVDAIEDAEYSLDGESWQESNVFEKLTAGQTYTFYARIKENKNFTAGQIGSSAGIDLEKLPGKGSVTIDSWTYGEEAASPATESSTGNPVEAYLYESTDGQGYSSDAVPTNAGDYKVTVSFGETTTHNGTKASAEFSIAKAIPQVETPSGISAIYGDTLADMLLPEGWAWEAEDSTPVGNVEDENEFTLIFTHPTEPNNYEQLRECVQITVSPKEVTAPSIQLAAGSFVYNGSAHRPLVTVKDGENIVPGSEYTVEYQNNVNAGTATVLVKDNAGGNYTISGQSSFRIVKAACSTPAALEREFLRTIATYGNVINLEQLLPQDHGTVSYSIGKGNSAILANVSVDANGKLVFDTRTAEAPSSSEITVDVVMENYEDITLTVLVSLTGKETPQIIGVSAAEGLRYSGKAQKGYIGAPRSEYTGNYEIFYSGRGNSYSSVLAPTEAGDYTVTFKIPESDLYYAGSLSLNFSIGKAPLKVVADDKEAQRWAEMPELSCKVLGLIGDDTVSVTLKCDADMDQAGEYPILVSAVDASGNYEIEAVEGTLTVSTRPYRPDVDDKDDDEDRKPAKPGKPGYIGTKECDGGLLCPLYPFQDVDRNAWYHDGLHYVVEEGLMQGMSSTSFAPNTATSRAMIVTILWRLEGSPMVDSSMRFEDVAAGAWYTEAIRWAAATGVVTGYSEKAFGPNDSITREQMAAILYRYAQYKGYALSGSSIQSYTDAANVSSWAKDAMEWACGSGLIQGSSNLLDPQGDAIRAQSATILHRFCEMLDK